MRCEELRKVKVFKTFYGTPETVRVHWMGLKHLVVARGGLKRLGDNEMVRKLVVA